MGLYVLAGSENANIENLQDLVRRLGDRQLVVQNDLIQPKYSPSGLGSSLIASSSRS